MAITRRSFLAGLGSVSVGLLFRRRLDRVLESLESDLADEPQSEGQQPSAAEIVVQPQMTFRPQQLIIPAAIVPLFAIEDIHIGDTSQLMHTGPIPAAVFASPGTGLAFDTIAPGKEIRFRVRYVGSDPRGARFFAGLVGMDVNGNRQVLPIDSLSPITT